MKPIVKTSLTHVGILLLFLVLSCVYFWPALTGKVIVQGDILKAEAMGAEQQRVGEAIGTIPTWNSAMFSGMPGYQTATPPQSSIFTTLKSLLIMRPLGLERSVGLFFLYLIGFYVALLAFGCNPWLSLLGAVAFAFGSYNIIIMEAGHITKGWAMAMIAPILGGMVLTLHGAKQWAHAEKKEPIWKQTKIVWGFILFTTALGLQITFNHIQITFYTIIGALALAITYLIYAIREKYVRQLLVAACVLLVGCGLAFGANLRHLLVNQEYAKYTMRGGSELTITPDGQEKSGTQSDGLDVDYAFMWSYGIGETYTLLVPGAYGGGSNEKVGQQSESYKAFRQNRMPLYWGEQPFTSGPVYFGAIVCFLFVLGLLVVRGPEKWWLLIATVVAILLSWGKNLMPINEFLFHYVPLYNKFRTPSMALVLANVTMVVLGILGLKEIFANGHEHRKQYTHAIYWATGLTVGLVVVVLLFSGSFSFSGASDRQMAAQYGKSWQQILTIFVADRKALLQHDSWRTILFILPTAIILWLYVNQKVKQAAYPLSIIAVLCLIDLWVVDRRYLDKSNFEEPRRLALKPSAHDKEIDRQAAVFGDYAYRVLDLSVNTFNDSQPSAFHHQIGGYSAAKLRRYQDLIDFHLTRPLNMDVLNMFNTRYVVQQDVRRNPAALGNAWYVAGIHPVNSADEEILALTHFSPADTAIVDMSQWADQVEGLHIERDSTATIDLVHEKIYNPDYLRYTTHANSPQLAVFSEIYYRPDWRAYIDGEAADYLRVNYVLRAMPIPAGDHVVEFRNEAPRMHQLDRWTMLFSILFACVVVGLIVVWYRAQRKEAM